MNSDLIQELTDCLGLALKNFESDTIPRPGEIKRLREALAAGKAIVEPPVITRPKVSSMEAHTEWTEAYKRRKKQEQAENRIGELAKMKMREPENQKRINAELSRAFEKQKAINDKRPATEVTVTFEPYSPAR